MYITHIALWTQNLEELKNFYVKYFGGKSNNKYTNEAKGFSSYFISFESGPSIEIMSKTDITQRAGGEQLGYCHIAFKTGSREKVSEYTEKLRKDGFKVLSEPRTTGDGYFESVIEDPDGNKIELVG